MKKILMENEGALILSSLLILLPLPCSLLLQQGMFYQPVFLLVIHWICLLITFRDWKNKEQDRKVLGMVFWIVPVISLLCGAVFLMVRTGQADDLILPVILYFGFGLLLVIIGNYLPKMRRNKTLGIKVKWTLENEENWNATHRFGGKIWVLAGFACMACALIPDTFFAGVLFAGAILAASLLPIGYSQRYYKKQLAEGRTEVIQRNPWTTALSGIGTVLILVFVIWVLFTGDMEVTYQDDFFTIETENWKDLTVSYQDIENIAYETRSLSEDRADIRTNGFGNLKMCLGAFSNDRYGDYTRYTYNSCDSYVELTVKGKIVVLNGPDAEATEKIYEALKERIQ